MKSEMSEATRSQRLAGNRVNGWIQPSGNEDGVKLTRGRRACMVGHRFGVAAPVLPARDRLFAHSHLSSARYVTCAPTLIFVVRGPEMNPVTFCLRGEYV